MPPLVGFLVELCRELAVGFRRDNRGDVTRQQVVAQPICVKCPVSQQVPRCQALQQRARFSQVMRLPRHQAEIHQVAERVGQSQYFGGYAASRASDGLAQSPPFAPWPERWTLTMVPSIIAYSKSELEAKALNIL